MHDPQPPRRENQPLRDHYLDAFREIGQRRRRHLDLVDEELRRAAVLIGPARAARTTVDAIADALGVSKPVLYQLSKTYGTVQHLRLSLLATIGARGGLTADQLAGELGLGMETVEEELRRDREEDLIKPVMAYYGGGAPQTTYWRLTSAGERETVRLVRELGEPELRRYHVYIELDESELARLPHAARPKMRFAVLLPEVTGISGRVRRPELALTVLAAHLEAAETQARDLFAELQADAELPARQPVIASVIDATGSR